MKIRDSNRLIVDQDLELIDELNQRIASTEAELAKRAKDCPWMDILQSVPGIGLFSAIVLASEIGNLDRFQSPERMILGEILYRG